MVSRKQLFAMDWLNAQDGASSSTVVRVRLAWRAIQALAVGWS